MRVYKGYRIENNQFSQKIIKPDGKGSSPKSLRGMFTSDREAQIAIDSYIRLKPEKKGGTPNGKKQTTDRAD